MESVALKVLFQDYPIAAYIIGIPALLGIAIKLLKSIFDFHHDFTRRNLRRVSELISQTQPDSSLQHFLQRVIADEVFTIASGVKASRRKALLLMHLCHNDVLSPRQIKSVARFIEPDSDGQVTIKMDVADRLFAWYSLATTLSIFLYGLGSFAALAWNGGVSNTLTGLIICAICTGSCLFLSGDFRNYRVVRRLERDLTARMLPICEEIRLPATETENSPRSVNNHEKKHAVPA